VRIKILGGTVKHGDTSLCLTCRHATVVIGTRLREEVVDCAMLAQGRSRISFAVTSCSSYSNKTLPSLREMEEIAWVLKTDPQRKSIGFVQSRQLKPHERFVLGDDDWP